MLSGCVQPSPAIRDSAPPRCDLPLTPAGCSTHREGGERRGFNSQQQPTPTVAKAPAPAPACRLVRAICCKQQAQTNQPKWCDRPHSGGLWQRERYSATHTHTHRWVRMSTQTSAVLEGCQHLQANKRYGPEHPYSKAHYYLLASSLNASGPLLGL